MNNWKNDLTCSFPRKNCCFAEPTLPYTMIKCFSVSDFVLYSKVSAQFTPPNYTKLYVTYCICIRNTTYIVMLQILRLYIDTKELMMLFQMITTKQWLLYICEEARLHLGKTIVNIIVSKYYINIIVNTIVNISFFNWKTYFEMLCGWSIPKCHWSSSSTILT